MDGVRPVGKRQNYLVWLWAKPRQVQQHPATEAHVLLKIGFGDKMGAGYRAQFSIFRFGTRLNSFSLLVTSVLVMERA